MKSRLLTKLETENPQNFGQLSMIFLYCNKDDFKSNEHEIIRNDRNISESDENEIIAKIKSFLDTQRLSLLKENYKAGCDLVLEVFVVQRLLPIKVIEILIEEGADIDKLVYGSTLLYRCALFSPENDYFTYHLDVGKILLDKGANPLILSQNPTLGENILHAAIYFRNAEIIQLLLETKFGVDLVNSFGKTALDYAKSCYNKEALQEYCSQYKAIIDILEKANQKAKDLSKQTNTNISDVEQPIKPKENTNFIRSIIDGIKSWSARAKNKISSSFRDFINFCKTLIFGDETPIQEQKDRKDRKDTLGQNSIPGQVTSSKQESPVRGNNSLINQ